MTNIELAQLGSIRDAFLIAEKSLNRALLHTPQLITRMRVAAKLGYVSPAFVELALSRASSANEHLVGARNAFGSSKVAIGTAGNNLVTNFGDVEPWPCLESRGGVQFFSYGDVEPIECPKKKEGSGTQLEVAFGDADQCPPNTWGLELGRPQEVAFGDGTYCPPKKTGELVAFGDHEIPSPEKKGSLAGADLVAIERSIAREVRLAEGMVDRALRCTTATMSGVLEERRKFRMPATFGQDVVDHMITASGCLSKAFAALYSVHEMLVEARELVAGQATVAQTKAA